MLRLRLGLGLGTSIWCNATEIHGAASLTVPVRAAAPALHTHQRLSAGISFLGSRAPPLPSVCPLFKHSRLSAAQCRYLLARQPAAPLAHCLPTFQTFTLISCSVQVSLARQPAAPAPRPPCPLFAHFSNSFATFQTFCPDGVHFAQTAVQFAHFQNQARKGVFWSEVGGVLCTYISPTRICDGWVKNRGCWWYSVQNETPSGQNETHLGNLYEK